MTSALAQQIKGRWREFCREPSALFFVVLMPVLWMAILGFAFSGNRTTQVGVGIVAGGESPLSEAVRAALAQKTDLHTRRAERDELLTALKKGDVDVLITIDDSAARLTFDPTKPQARTSAAYVADVIQRAAGRVDPIALSEELVTLPGQRYVDFLVPGLLALSLMTSSLFGTGMTIVANRRENLLKRYLATPMRPLDYILSHIVGRGFVLAVEVSTILIAAFALFRYRVDGRLADLVLFAGLGAAAFTALALLLGSRTANMATMNGATNLISLPMMIVSGVWFSRANFPDWIAEPARYLPLTALVDGLRRIALEGSGLPGVAQEAAILTTYLLVATISAKASFKWY